jgi:hypothetical protein
MAQKRFGSNRGLAGWSCRGVQEKMTGTNHAW